MSYCEKHFQTEFGHKNTRAGAFELKIEKSKSFRFDRVAVHQEEALLKASTTGLYHKISDSPVSWQTKMRFNSKKPFDAIVLRDADAYVVIMFYIPRKKKTVMYFFIDDFIRAREDISKKSAREDELIPYAISVEEWI